MESKKDQLLKDKVAEQNAKLKECLKINNETVTVANETNKELFAQEEQIDRIDKKLNDISDDLHKSKWLFRGVKSTFGMIKNIFTSPKKCKREKKPENKTKEIQTASSTNSSEPKKNVEISNGSNNKIYENKTIGKEIKEQDAILDEILDSVNQLKNTAKVTSETLDAQSKKFDKINSKVDKNSKEMEKLNKDMKNYLK